MNHERDSGITDTTVHGGAGGWRFFPASPAGVAGVICAIRALLHFFGYFPVHLAEERGIIHMANVGTFWEMRMSDMEMVWGFEETAKAILCCVLFFAIAGGIADSLSGIQNGFVHWVAGTALYSVAMILQFWALIVHIPGGRHLFGGQAVVPAIALGLTAACVFLLTGFRQWDRALRRVKLGKLLAGQIVNQHFGH